MIKSLQEQTDTTIEIEEDGTIYISCIGRRRSPQGQRDDRGDDPAAGDRPDLQRGQGGLRQGFRRASSRSCPAWKDSATSASSARSYVKHVEDVCKIGDIIPVKLLLIDEQGRYKLSRKAALEELGIVEEKKEGQGEGQGEERRGERRRDDRRDDRRPRHGGGRR